MSCVHEAALKQIACDHKRESGEPGIAGGNDYLMCWKCGLEWDYRVRSQPSSREIARLALDGQLFSANNSPRQVTEKGEGEEK